MNFFLQMSGATASGSITPEASAQLATAFGLMFGGIIFFLGVLWVAVMTLMLISRRRLFEKAGLPGRGAIIPGYNRYLAFELGGRSGWNVLWIFFPPVFGILMIINYFRIANKFNKHRSFGLGMVLLKCIFIPILAFDKSRYELDGRNTFPRPHTPQLSPEPTHKVSKRPTMRKPLSKKPSATKVIKKKSVKK